jgi:hypothetical protein
MTTEAEKAYKVWLAEQQVAGCWFDPELLKSSFVHGYESTFSAGHASRDAEVAKLEAEVKGLQQRLFISETEGNFRPCSKCLEANKETK